MNLVDKNVTQQFSSNDANGIDGRTDKDSKPYSTPDLKLLGKLSTVTLGGSPGVGDSGNPGTQQPPA